MVPRTNYGSHNWSATGGTNGGRGGPTMAATIGPGGPFMAREIAIAGPPPPGPISAADHPLRDRSQYKKTTIIVYD